MKFARKNEKRKEVFCLDTFTYSLDTLPLYVINEKATFAFEQNYIDFC